ncbi:MAG TPA: carbohydrate ABC transporter permease [Rubrobacteraceae bacterium]|nr:carbohydrate ABC transporter permease [Rubrobacteraceae bacterium]
MQSSPAFRVFIYSAAVFAGAVILAPFVWLLISSVAAPADLLVRPLKWIPAHASLSRYAEIFFGAGDDTAITFRAAMVNSTIVAGSSVLISLGVGIFGAYAFARLRFRFQRAILLLFLSTYMLPPIALLISLYLTMAQLRLLDTRIGLILVYCSFITPFVLWIMSGYFRSIPRDLEDAARIDGCSRMGALFRVILPLARPGLLATALFGFLLAWDEFLYALIFTSSLESKTIPVAIAEFTGRHAVDFGMMATGGVLASLPPLAIAFLFQRYIVGGLASGAVKG